MTVVSNGLNNIIKHWLTNYSREWDAAEKILRQLHKGDPERKLYNMYLERIDELRYEVLPDDWMGVFEHRSK